MGNMTYCMFQKTLGDLRQCIAAAEDYDTAEQLFSSLSEKEAKAARSLLKLCRQFADDYDDDAADEIRRLRAISEQAGEENKKLRGLVSEALEAGDPVYEFGTDLYGRMVSAVTPNV